MAQYISVKRKQQTNKHAPLAIMLCLLLLFSSFCFVFAEDSNIVELPLVNDGGTPSTTDLINNGILLYSGNAFSSSVSIYVGNTTETSSPVYCGLYLNESNYLYAVFAVDDSTSGFNAYATKSNGNPTSITFNTGTFTSTSSGITYKTGQYPIGTNTSGYTYTPFSSFQDFVDTIGTSSGGGGGITNNGNAIIVVNPGNAAYIGYDSAIFNFLINLNKPVSSLNSNARYGFASELPSGVLTFTPSSGNALPLRKSVPDLLGRSATWVGSVDTDTVGYFIVYNPVYDLNGNTNPPIRVTVTVGYMNVTQFPLTASDIGGDIISTGNSDNFYISDGVQGGTDLPSYIYSQTDQNGNVTTSSALTVPVTPYNYTTQSAGTAESGLQGFIQQILDLLSAPIKLIQNLYDSAVGFFNYLSSLWSWLPPELTTIIVSALGVLVVIGVVKFLWK